MEITKYDDVIDSRDVIARIEELESDRDDFVSGSPDGEETPDPQAWAAENPDDAEELKVLKALAEEAKGYSEDWIHGATLIRYSYFETYAQELADDLGYMDDKNSQSWPFNHIDWEAAARDLRQDYTEVDFDGVAYFVR